MHDKPCCRALKMLFFVKHEQHDCTYSCNFSKAFENRRLDRFLVMHFCLFKSPVVCLCFPLKFLLISPHAELDKLKRFNL